MKRVDTPVRSDGNAYGIVIAGHFREGDAYVTRRPEGMEDWLITFTLDGEGYFDVPGGRAVCRAGEITLLRAGTPHEYGTVKGKTWHFVWAHFSSHYIEDELLPSESVSLHAIESGSVRKRVYRAFRRILADSRERNPYWHQLCLDALREILILLAQRRSSRLDPRVEEALHYLSVHMREPITIDAIAKSVRLSPSRLSHMFKEATGHSIIDTLNKMRIRQAALLLEHTNRSASEVAFDVGFHNYNHFINQFRKWYGVSPSEFRRRR